MKRFMLKDIPVKSGNATHIEVELYYNIGGTNYFTYNVEKRGIYLSVSPVSKVDKGEYQTRSYTAFSGIKKLKKELKRFSKNCLMSVEIPTKEIEDMVNHVAIQNNLTI